MAYGYAQHVIQARPEDVARAARRLASSWGMVAGPPRSTRGFLGERIVPLSGRRSRARLWLWPLDPRWTAVYLGLDDLAVAARLPVAAAFARHRSMRRAARAVEDLRALTGGGGEPSEMRRAA